MRGVVRAFRAVILLVCAVTATHGCLFHPSTRSRIDHSSPEAIVSSFSHALSRRDTRELGEAVEPSLKAVWKEWIDWAEKLRDAGLAPTSDCDLIMALERRLCGDDVDLVFERMQSDLMVVRNRHQKALIYLRRREGRWYVSLYGNPGEDECMMKLAVEMIKYRLEQQAKENPGGP